MITTGKQRHGPGASSRFRHAMTMAQGRHGGRPAAHRRHATFGRAATLALSRDETILIDADMRSATKPRERRRQSESPAQLAFLSLMKS
jgi:hypothetical protein